MTAGERFGMAASIAAALAVLGCDDEPARGDGGAARDAGHAGRGDAGCDAGGAARAFSLASVESWPLCRMVGPGNHRPGLYGADLGMSFVHPQGMPGETPDDARLVLFFGDAQTSDRSVCEFPPRPSDDIRASLPATRPDVLTAGEPDLDAAQEACAALELPRSTTDDPAAWPPLRLFSSAAERSDDTLVDTSLGRTPVAGFSDGEHAYAIYLRDELVRCDRDADCDHGMRCSADPGYLGRPIGACAPAFALVPDPLPIMCLSDPECGMNRTCEPPEHGFCLVREPYSVPGGTPPSWYEEDPRRGVEWVMSIASAAWDDRPGDFAIGARFVTHHFVNLAARTVANFDFDDPSKNDYRPGNHTLLLWGRPTFLVRRRWQSLPFLLAQPLEGLRRADGTIAWAPRFFAGYRADGRPRWSEDEADAQPLYGGDPDAPDDADAGTSPAEPEFSLVNQMSVSYVPALHRFVMFYSGGLARFFFFDPEMMRELDPVFPQPEEGATYLRAAAHPWGRATRDAPSDEGWSAPQVLLRRADISQYLACDDAEKLPGCTDEHDAYRPLRLLLTVDAITDPDPAPGVITQSCLDGDIARNTLYNLSGDAVGHLYGSAILEPWTEDVTDRVDGLAPGERAVEVYWNVSTWNPYQVALVKTQLRARVP